MCSSLDAFCSWRLHAWVEMSWKVTTVVVLWCKTPPLVPCCLWWFSHGRFVCHGGEWCNLLWIYFTNGLEPPQLLGRYVFFVCGLFTDVGISTSWKHTAVDQESQGPRVFPPDGKDSQDSVILLADDDDAVTRRKIISFGAWFLKDPGPRWEFSYRYWGAWIQMKRRNSMTFHQRMNTPAEVDVLCLLKKKVQY